MEDRRKLANGRAIWVIKAGFPDTPAGKNWSDYVFAHSLKKYLERLGHYVVVESCGEWLNDRDADVVVVLRGTKRYIPDRTLDDRIYMMWHLSHPSQVTDEEYSAYDLVCISSEPYGKMVGDRLRVPVKVLPMCADTEIFYPDSNPSREKEFDWIFVGNSRHMERKCVTWSVEHGIPLKIWGADWEKFVPDSGKYVMAENMPNDKLPDLYRNAKATVCDHYEDMIENGFINTRIVEAFACGLPVLSDYSEVLGTLFGDAILCYRDEAEFAEQAERMEREYEQIGEKVRALWPLIEEKYSFKACARQLDEFAAKVRERRESCKVQVRALAERRRGREKYGEMYAEESRGTETDREAAVEINIEERRGREADKEMYAEENRGTETDREADEEMYAEESRGTETDREAFGETCVEEAHVEENIGIAHTYRCFCNLVHMIASADEDMQNGCLQEALHTLREGYNGLTWTEQQAFTELKGRERFLFDLFVRSGAGGPYPDRDAFTSAAYQELEAAKGQLEELGREKDELKDRLRRVTGEKAEINQNLQRAYKEKSEINQKLQQTYKEKSEINRKLQITYGEKYDRGLRIKSLEKELASVKKSRTYRLARIIGFPVRFLRKMRKKIKE